LFTASLGGLQYRRPHNGKAAGLSQELDDTRLTSRLGEAGIIISAQHDHRDIWT